MRHLNRLLVFIVVLSISIGAACHADPSGPTKSSEKPKPAADLSGVPKGMSVALFAGGCFWCMEPPFDQTKGVVKTTSGYTDGFVKNPAYVAVARGLTGHTEAVQIIFDPKIVSYEDLLEIFWRNIDPLSKNGQFCDRGTQYRSGIYTYNQSQQQQAQAAFKKLNAETRFNGKIATEIKSATKFYPAEDYHQDFYLKKPDHYKQYRRGCGRDQRLKMIWDAAK